jgi:Tol biopolymer transport system component
MERKVIQLLILLIIFSFVIVLPVTAAKKVENGNIVFTTSRDGNSEIYSMNPDGSGQFDLTNNPSSDYSPKLSPDASKIAFLSNRDGNLDEIYVMNADGSDQTRIIRTEPGWIGWLGGWTPDSQKIWFISYNEDAQDGVYWRTFTINIDGTEQKTIFEGGAGPIWSPDETKIAFNDGSIHMMNADGTNSRLIFECSEVHRCGTPTWSPDSKKIAFSYGGPEGGDIAILTVDNPRSALPLIPTIIPRDWQCNSPEWSPDGKQIAYYSLYGTNPGVFETDLKGSKTTQLYSGKNVNQLSWSPDGSKLVFYAKIDNKNQIFVANADGTGTNQLTNLGGNDHPVWGTNTCPKCKVEVKAHGVDISANQFWHTFIVYTDSNGKEWYYRGGPLYTGIPIPGSWLGPIITEMGEFKKGTIDYVHPMKSITVLQGTNAYGKDQCFKNEMIRINSLNIPYAIHGPNSNTVTRTALHNCGCPEITPVIPVPGWNHPYI